MRVGVLDDHRVVVVEESTVVDIGHLLGPARPGPDGQRRGPDGVNDRLAALAGNEPAVRAYLGGAPRLPLAGLRFLAPSPRPRTLLAAPVNYRAHAGELGGRSPSAGRDARQLGLIVLASGSVTGPAPLGRIELPDLPGREFHFEGEIAVVIGRAARNVPETTALSHVLGYTGLIDVTLRLSDEHFEERSMRKSYHTFTPIGPYLLVTAGAPAEAELELAHNGEVRQRGRLRDLIVGVPELVSRASRMLPLLPGDVIATGTPAGVGPITPGDELSLRVSGVGELRMPVVRRGW
jgi:2-keto-4-pentenoate hydratase/2-oxohepta-3-ene-1,7-dioic acid hydratase in catechol pathway